MECIISENSDKTIEILIPTVQALQLFDLKTIGEKSIFLGLPFWVKEESVLPSGYSDRNAWRLDGTEGKPSGYGKRI